MSIILRDASGRRPNIGIIITPEEAKASLAAVGLLQEIGPQELLFYYDPMAGHRGSAFEDFATLAAKYIGSTSLEIALPCQAALIDETSAIASNMKAAGFIPDAIIVSPSPCVRTHTAAKRWKTRMENSQKHSPLATPHLSWMRSSTA